MNRFVTSIHARVAAPIICGLLLLTAAVVACSPPSDVMIQQPTAVAAQPVPQPVGDAGISTQPFVAIAKQAKAAVVNISSVKKNKNRNELGASPFLTTRFSAVSSAKNSRVAYLFLGNIGNKGLVPA